MTLIKVEISLFISWGTIRSSKVDLSSLIVFLVFAPNSYINFFKYCIDGMRSPTQCYIVCIFFLSFLVFDSKVPFILVIAVV